jgi:hypothetical protein
VRLTRDFCGQKSGALKLVSPSSKAAVGRSVFGWAGLNLDFYFVVKRSATKSPNAEQPCSSQPMHRHPSRPLLDVLLAIGGELSGPTTSSSGWSDWPENNAELFNDRMSSRMSSSPAMMSYDYRRCKVIDQPFGICILYSSFR